MAITARTVLAIMFLSVLAGCSTAHPGAGGSWKGFTETGQASFYADKFQNRTTASGATFKQERDTAAHKTLPFGSMVEVTNTANGKSVVVEINDRGPFVEGRIIDLTKSAFRRIGNPSLGLIDVEIEVLR
ncbi:septal ring lytic transglycosylase RlpA family protein [Marinobacter salinisoli]|uniref:Endolytic peptidoglycan transglycosylase RlpA n=1 Tax=Marinobacter salinisoli TaxID=2769486 RepID=A0ABX7MRF2_9GAMM|nr:septal ring lytic transglycosylase RlpA family protein [Marinobacter salinisoli]QSP94927.1 septal ring lytic transglycosylase RlpA family protein [Marinobacter salinisoli]